MKQSFAIENELAAITYADTPSIDAFSRLRVSNPHTIFEVLNQYNSESLRMESGNTGSGVLPAHQANSRMVLLQINAGAGPSSSFVQSFSYLPYQPGKSQLILMTGVFGPGVSGAVQRFGYGDATNGIFYEQSGSTVQLNLISSVSGGIVNNIVTKANWNLDKMDGTGPSGIILDPTKTFILFIDLQFLAMGRVRVGFDINGTVFYVHQFLTANLTTVPYMQMATLPVKAEITAAGALATPCTAQFKCAGVCSEGGLDIALGRTFTAEGTVTAASGARTHILSIQPTTTFPAGVFTNRGLIIPLSIELLAGANPILW